MAERDPRPGGLSCRASRTLLARDAADGAIGLDRLSGAERDRLEQHVAGCAACQTRLDQLAAAVLSLREDEIPCAECGPALDDWLAGERAGEDPRRSMPRVAAHLAICPECSAELFALQEAWEALESGTLPVPEHEPTFDLSFLRTTGPVASSTQVPETVAEAAGGAVDGAADEPSATDPAPDRQARPNGLSTLLATLRSRFGQSARKASPPSSTPPSRRAFGELLLPLGAVALLLLFLLEVVRPGDPTTTEPGATATTAPTAVSTAASDLTGTPATATPTATPSGPTATPIGGIGPAAEPGSPTPDGNPTAEGDDSPDGSSSDDDNRGSRDKDRDDDTDAAPTPRPSPATGYPGPDPNAQPTSGYPGPPTSEAAPTEDVTPEPGAGYPGPDPTAAPTDAPTSPPSPGGTPTAEDR